MLMRTSNQNAESANRFLSRLSAEDRALVGDRLERISVTCGNVLVSAGALIEFVYFPEIPIVSIRNDGGDGRGIETAVVGCEGIVGWSGLAGCERSTQSAVTQMRSGTLLRIPTEEMRKACGTSRTLLSAVMLFIEMVMGQMAQAIVSHLRDTIERRVCRWLLMRHDRIPSDQLLIRHDDISANLGVRRASVTDCLHILEGKSFIRCYRGRVIIRSRAGLEVLAGGSYGGPEAYYRTLIGPFGRDRDPTAGAARQSAATPARLGGYDRRLISVLPLAL